MVIAYVAVYVHVKIRDLEQEIGYVVIHGKVVSDIDFCIRYMVEIGFVVIPDAVALESSVSRQKISESGIADRMARSIDVFVDKVTYFLKGNLILQVS